MRRLRTALVLAISATVVLAFAAAATAAPTVGTTFPAGFPTITDASLGVPVIGFGAAGTVHRTPVILLHGNNDTPYPTACNPFGSVHALAQYLVDHGYAPSEVWALGYQGDQCDLARRPDAQVGRRALDAPERPRPRRVRPRGPQSTRMPRRSTSSATASASRSPARG